MGSYRALKIPKNPKDWHTSSNVPQTCEVCRTGSRGPGKDVGLPAS